MRYGIAITRREIKRELARARRRERGGLTWRQWDRIHRPAGEKRSLV